mgnify:CR=1 FL=1
MSLKSKILRSGIALGIGLASLVSDGCATYEDTTALGVGLEILGGRAIDPNLGRAFNAAAGGAYSAANNQAMVEAAPRINQTVNIGGVNIENQSGKMDYVILKDYCKVNGQNFVEGQITKIYGDNLWILSQGRSYNIQNKDVIRVIDN